MFEISITTISEINVEVVGPALQSAVFLLTYLATRSNKITKRIVISPNNIDYV